MIMKWIPVKERIPEFGRPVLVYCESYGTYIGVYERLGDSNWGNWKDGEGNIGIPPTHWMPLPERPGRENEFEDDDIPF